MKADAESKIASRLKAEDERLNAQSQEYVSELRKMYEKHFDGHIISEKEWERYIPKISVKTCMNCFYNYGVRHNVEFNPKDIVCEYWESDGLTKDDFCSRWKDKESEG